MDEWLQVLRNPEIMIPAILSTFFTLFGAFGGVYLSSKHAFRLSRFNRLMNLKQELHEFKLAIEAMESHLPIIHSAKKLDRLIKIELSSMIKKVKEELLSKIMSAKKPSTLENLDIINLINALSYLEYCIVENKDDEIIFQAFQKYKREINRLKISLEISLKY